MHEDWPTAEKMHATWIWYGYDDEAITDTWVWNATYGHYHGEKYGARIEPTNDGHFVDIKEYDPWENLKHGELYELVFIDTATSKYDIVYGFVHRKEKDTEIILPTGDKFSKTCARYELRRAVHCAIVKDNQ